jgi:hypothetical protein
MEVFMTTRVLNPKVHGIIDYLAVAFLFIAPSLFGFTGTTPATVAYVAGAAQLLLSLMTAYPMGVIRAIPFPVHGGIELTLALGLAASPWIFGYSGIDLIRNLFIATGAAVVLVWATTDYQAAVKRVSRKEHIIELKEHRRAA